MKVELFGDWLSLNSNPFGDSKDIPKGYIMLPIDKIGIDYKLKPKIDYEKAYKDSRYPETFSEFKKRLMDEFDASETGDWIKKDVFDISALVISDFNILIKNKLSNISKTIHKNQYDMAEIYLDKSGELSVLNIFTNKFKEVKKIESDKLLSTKGRVFIQFKWGNPNSVFLRTEGVKKSDLMGEDLYKFSDRLSERLNCKLILVNDVSDVIYLMDSKSDKFEKISSVESWVEAYKNLGL